MRQACPAPAAIEQPRPWIRCGAPTPAARHKHAIAGWGVGGWRAGAWECQVSCPALAQACVPATQGRAQHWGACLEAGHQAIVLVAQPVGVCCLAAFYGTAQPANVAAGSVERLRPDVHAEGLQEGSTPSAAQPDRMPAAACQVHGLLSCQARTQCNLASSAPRSRPEKAPLCIRCQCCAPRQRPPRTASPGRATPCWPPVSAHG